MRLLLLTHGFNSLTQRLFVDLRDDGHTVSVEFDVSDDVTREAVDLFAPDLVIAPFLKRAIPEDVWRRVRCLIVHPGVVGDRGPSALDWAILEGARTWGVTVIEAAADLDAGDVWAARTFPMRPATKSSLYRTEVTDGAVAAVREALDKIRAGQTRGTPVSPDASGVPGRPRPAMTQADRRIDWTTDTTAQVLAKVRASDGFPGVRDEILGLPVSLYHARPALGLAGAPGQVLGSGGEAVAIATTDGAVWIGHLIDRSGACDPLKLPAVRVLGRQRLAEVPELPAGPLEIWTERQDGVCFIHFPFHNGAMTADQCRRLRAAFLAAVDGDERIIALMGGPEFWSNGLHLTVIEAADSPADESWATIRAMNDLAGAILTRTDRWVVSAMQGNAGAGGVFLALAADVVWARAGVVLNPHYKGMGNLYGSEYWTYVLPRRVGEARARRIAEARLPMGTAEALRLGLLDDAFGADAAAFRADLRQRLAALAADPRTLDARLADKAARRAADEAARPLAAYQTAELEHMRLNFFGFDPSYHIARSHFVHKTPKAHTPLALALHRRGAATP
ncbi:hydrogenase maturation protein [Roseospira visakhapatnamensis]|uniref:Putative two-component system hydrogenase maturation factor HypX/HoxX n=1 Tax=Roseospira visakhapatnamensis TaxID=390880 RepID=A0A7W6RFK1_9PROT|nr:hydrogenase maturation protein [Roseospira visakhapatnamensis]MBB4267104.1 putative two-component system hydrogenase maturation factor HypX/HoxX [Roseospira visakhapatnamensis]